MASPPPPATTAGARARRLAWLAVYASCLAWLVHFWPTFHAANESIRVYFAEAVVDHGTPVLDEVLARYDVRNVDRAEWNGHAYLDKAPGLSLWALPFYAVFTRVLGLSTAFADLRWIGWLLLLTSVVPLALAGAWAVRRLGELDGDASSAADATLALAVGTPFLLYGTLYFGHTPAAALAVLAYLAVRLEKPAVAGALTGVMVLTETPTAALGALLALVLWLRTRSFGALVRFGLGGLPFAIVQLGYNKWLFGSALDSAYAHKASKDLAGIHGQGFLGFRLPTWATVSGLVLSTKRGLWLHAPVVLLGAAGLVRGLAREVPAPARALARDAALLGGGYALVIAGFVDWPAGASYANRHLVPTMPFFALGLVPLAAGLAPRARRALAVSLGALVAVGAGANVLAATTFPYAPDAIDAPLADLAWPLLRAGAVAPSWLEAIAPGVSPVVVVGGFVALVVASAAAILAGRAGAERVAGGAVLGVVALAAAIALAPSRTPSPTSVQASLACIAGRRGPAASLCAEADGRFDEAACRCALPPRP